MPTHNLDCPLNELVVFAMNYALLGIPNPVLQLIVPKPLDHHFPHTPWAGAQLPAAQSIRKPWQKRKAFFALVKPFLGK